MNCWNTLPILASALSPKLSPDFMPLPRSQCSPSATILRPQSRATNTRWRLVDWLNEVLYCFDGRRIAFREFRVVSFRDHAIAAVGLGEPRDPERHRANLIVKAVTWHQLKIEQRDGIWTAEVYLDI